MAFEEINNERTLTRIQLASESSGARTWSTVLTTLATYLPSNETRRTNCIVSVGSSNITYRYIGDNSFVWTGYSGSGKNLKSTVLNFSDKKAYSSSNGAAFTEDTGTISSVVRLYEMVIS